MLDRNIISEIELSNLSEKIEEFYNEASLNDVQREILRLKYIDLKKDINVRRIAKEHATSMKRVKLELEKLDGKLFTFLKKYV